MSQAGESPYFRWQYFLNPGANLSRKYGCCTTRRYGYNKWAAIDNRWRDIATVDRIVDGVAKNTGSARGSKHCLLYSIIISGRDDEPLAFQVRGSKFPRDLAGLPASCQLGNMLADPWSDNGKLSTGREQQASLARSDATCANEQAMPALEIKKSRKVVHVISIDIERPL